MIGHMRYLRHATRSHHTILPQDRALGRSVKKYHADHMPPNKIAKQRKASFLGRALEAIGMRVAQQRFYPQCQTCSNRQGSLLLANKKGFVYHFGSIRAYHFTGVGLAGAGMARGLTTNVNMTSKPPMVVPPRADVTRGKEQAHENTRTAAREQKYQQEQGAAALLASLGVLRREELDLKTKLLLLETQLKVLQAGEKQLCTRERAAVQVRLGEINAKKVKIKAKARKEGRGKWAWW